jgi:hypothetical protein
LRRFASAFKVSIGVIVILNTDHAKEVIKAARNGFAGNQAD